MKFESILKILSKSSSVYHYIIDGKQYLGNGFAVYDISGMSALDAKTIGTMVGSEIPYSFFDTSKIKFEFDVENDELLHKYKYINDINGYKVMHADGTPVFIDEKWLSPLRDGTGYTYYLRKIASNQIIIVMQGFLFCAALCGYKINGSTELAAIANKITDGDEDE